MSLLECQNAVRDFCVGNRLESRPEIHLLDLLSELGEVAKEFLKKTKYGKDTFAPTPKWGEEMGDALFAIICLANSTQSDLDTVLKEVLAKYQSRINAKGTPSSGV
jgi:NTP pyrophosphatase (non-canonical NTP hydrolase)